MAKDIRIDKNVMVAMRDGVLLATDVYHPETGEPAPTLVMRLPYDKESTTQEISPLHDIFRIVRAGYVVVVQDCRGRAASEGTFTPMFQEAADGADTIAWAAGQPWSNGRVGTFGGSYVGSTQWLAAGEAPPALLWFQISEGSNKGVTRLLRRLGRHRTRGLRVGRPRRLPPSLPRVVTQRPRPATLLGTIFRLIGHLSPFFLRASIPADSTPCGRETLI